MTKKKSPEPQRRRRARRPHQKRRHRLIIPEVPRDERIAAVERLLKRHPVHGVALLVVARTCARSARLFDALRSLAEWLQEADRLITELRVPRPLADERLFWADELAGLDRICINDFVTQARHVHEGLSKLLVTGRRLHDALTRPDEARELELRRDVDLMAGAGALRYAVQNGFPLSFADIVDVGVAIGLDRHDREGRSAESRWRKRKPALVAVAALIELKVQPPDAYTLAHAKFFDPL